MDSPLPGPRLPRSVLLLSALFALSGIAGIIVVTAASVVGLQLSGKESLATLPVGLALLRTMATTFPASRLMARHGRRLGFALGTSIACTGAAVSALAIVRHEFWLFCAGTFLIGANAGVAPFYRFAAVELSPGQLRGRAISTVLAGGVAAGLLGPWLGVQSADLAPERFVGSYLLMVLVGLLVLLLLSVARLPPAPVKGATIGGRPIGVIAADPRFAAAILAAAVAMGAMVLTMVAAPLSLKHAGHSLSDTGYVIQAHVVAMYAPAFFSGRLVERFGTGRIMAGGLTLLGACVAINLSGDSVAHHWSALVLLGAGWNFLFVAGTTLLTTTHTDAEKGTVQGLNDLVVASVGALAALSAGPAIGNLRWSGLNLTVLTALGLASLVLLVLGRRPAPRAAATA